MARQSSPIDGACPCSARSVPQNSAVYDASGTGTETLELLEAATAYNRWIAGLFRPYLRDENFELGAGRGTLTAIIAETHRVTPFEISSFNAAFVEQRFASHERVAQCRSDMMTCDEFDSVDCIYSANVLEHIEDDATVVGHCGRLLRVGGWFVAFVPAGQWLYSRFDRELGHFRRYTAADGTRLKRLKSGEAELHLRRFKLLNCPGAFGWFFKMRLMGSVSVSPRDAATIGRLMPMIKLLNELPLPIGQSALLAWQRVS